MRLRDLNLRIRTMLIGALALFGFAGVVGVLLWSDARREGLSAQTAELLDQQALVVEVDRDFLQARRFEKDFLLRLETDLIDRHATVTQTLIDTLAALAPRLDDDLAVKANESGAIVQDYSDQFKAVAEIWAELGFDENRGMQGALRSAVHSAEEVVNAQGRDDMLVLILMMRRHEKDFMMREDAKYIASLDDRVAEFTALLDADVALDAEVSATIGSAISAYQTAFHDYASTRLQIRDAVAQLSDLYAEAEPMLAQLMDSLNAAYAATMVSGTELANEARWITFALIGAIAVIVVLVALVIGRSISRPVLALTGVMEKLAGGDLAVAVDTSGRDEIARMASTVLVFRDSMERSRTLQVEEAQRQEVELSRGRRLAEATEAFDADVKTMLEALGSAAGEMNTTADSMSHMANQAGESVSEAATATEQSSANVQTVATATNELSHSIAEIASQLDRAAQAVAATTQEAAATTDVVNELNNTADEIGEIVNLIQAIAEQTNLLALNATIESARAGEAGKGFAVVAAEVKGLAGQTADATARIAEQIAGVQELTKRAVGAIERIASRVGEVDEMTTAVATAVEEQNSATIEISSNIEMIAQVAETLRQSMVDVAEIARKNGTLSGDVQRVSSRVEQQSTTLGTRIHKFLAQVQVA